MRRFAQGGARDLADFAGAWTLSRVISQGDGTTARFDGQAVWSWQDGAAEPTLDYVETGTLRLPGQRPMEAERRYLWRSGPTVWFDDGRFFHAVPKAGGAAHHFCAPDDYRVSYDFSDWPDFSTRWIVSGPRKDYIMDTRFRRAT